MNKRIISNSDDSEPKGRPARGEWNGVSEASPRPDLICHDQTPDRSSEPARCRHTPNLRPPFPPATSRHHRHSRSRFSLMSCHDAEGIVSKPSKQYLRHSTQRARLAVHLQMPNSKATFPPLSNMHLSIFSPPSV